LFPVGRIVPLSGCPPLMTKLPIPLQFMSVRGHGGLLYPGHVSARSSFEHGGCRSCLVH
jgi:hypothetical protein